MTDLETELVQAQIELAEARKIFEENPAWGRNKKALRAAEKKVAEAKLAFESRQGKIFDSEEEEVLRSNRWKYEM